MAEAQADDQIALCLSRLTLRQREVYDFLVRTYLSNKEIATALRVTESNVKQHTSKIYRKFHVRDRIQLINTVTPRTPSFMAGGEL